jgi:hypothetical protein
MSRCSPLRIRVVQGSPIVVGNTTLIPLARLVSWGWRQATVTRRGFGGQGCAGCLLIPTAVIEHRGDQSQQNDSGRRISIPDRTGQALLAMAGAGLAVALLSVLVEAFVLSARVDKKGR